MSFKPHKKSLQRFKAGSNKLSTKPPTLPHTKLSTALKEKLQKYYATVYSRSSVIQM